MSNDLTWWRHYCDIWNFTKVQSIELHAKLSVDTGYRQAIFCQSTFFNVVIRRIETEFYAWIPEPIINWNLYSSDVFRWMIDKLTTVELKISAIKERDILAMSRSSVIRGDLSLSPRSRGPPRISPSNLPCQKLRPVATFAWKLCDS